MASIPAGELRVFLDALLHEPSLSSRYEVKKFLDPSNYTENVYNAALRDVYMFFRSEPTWNVHKPLKDIGSLRIKVSQAVLFDRVQDQPKPAQSPALMDAARTSLLS
eukprot:Em0001g3666a